MKRLVFLPLLTLFTVLSLYLSSCTKELSPIGIDLLDTLDLLSMGYTDTVQIKAYSILEDSVNTSGLSYAQIGSLYDPIFGVTNTTFYSQIYLTKASTKFGTDPVFDSAYLYLPYKGSYGDTLSNMTLTVYALNESIRDSFNYFSNATLDYDEANPLGEITFQPKPHDSAFFKGVKQAPMLRIPINSVFGNQVLGITDTTYLMNNVQFVKFFKGICIVAKPQNMEGKGCILNFDLTTDYSLIQMYYHNTEDTTNYIFTINNSNSTFQNYDHNGYAEAIPMLKQQLEGNVSLGEQFLFAQGLGGVKIKIEFPYISKWFESQMIVVNDAQLILGNSSVSPLFDNPAKITLRSVGEAGTTNPNSLDDESEGAGYFDGYYNESSNSYRFRITRYIQQVLTGQENKNGLHLIIPSSNYLATRLVLNGTSSPQSDLKLYLRYTKIK